MPDLLKLGLEEGSADPAWGRQPDWTYQLDVGRVISQTFSVTLANLWHFFLIGLIVTSPKFLMLLLATVAGTGEAQMLILFSGLVGRLMELVLTGALTYAVVEHLRGSQPDLGTSLQVGTRSLWRLFVVSLVAGLVMLVGLVLCIVPGIIVWCALWVAAPVAVMEQAGIQESLDRSQELTKGTRVAIFAVTLVMFLITAVIGIVLFSGTMAAAIALNARGVDLSPQVQAIVQLVGSLLVIPVQCLGAASAAVGYYDLRTNREGVQVDDLVKVFE